MRGHVDGIKKHRSPWAGRRTWNWAAAEAREVGTSARPGVDLYLVQGLLEARNRTSEVLKKIDVHVEAEHGRHVFRSESALQKRAANFLFDSQDLLLAAAGIDQDPERQGKVGLGLKVLDGLRLTIFEDIKVVLREAGNQRSMLVFDVKEQLHDFDTGLEGRAGLVVSGRLLILRILRTRGESESQHESERRGSPVRSEMQLRHERFSPENFAS